MSANPVTDLDVVLACQEAERRTVAPYCNRAGQKWQAGQLLINFVDNRKIATFEDVENAMIRAWARDLIEVKTNLRWATLTAKGKQLAKENADVNAAD